MRLRLCPDCEKAFYSKTDGLHTVCHHCGYVVLDLRDRRRNSVELSLKCQKGFSNFMARLIDYSGVELRIAYRGESISRDTLFTLDIEDLGMHCIVRAIWTVSVEGVGMVSGLKILDA